MLSGQSKRKVIDAYRQILCDSSVNLVELTELSRKIFTALDSGLVFLYLCREGKATASAIMRDLELPESSAHRVLKKLQDMGMIEVVCLLPHKKKSGGPRERLLGIAR